jgi:hypothetical protein
VLPVQDDQPLPRQEPQPEERRHRRRGEVLGLPPVDVEERLLEHVRGVDPPLEAAVHPEPDHPPQPAAVPAEELDERPGVAGVHPGGEGLVAAVVRHDGPPGLESGHIADPTRC